MYIEDFREFNPSEHYEVLIVFDKDSKFAPFFVSVYDKMDYNGVQQFDTKTKTLDEAIKQVKDFIKEV